MKQKINKKNGGFTLVEILIAITILGIIVVPFMHSFVTASRTNAKSKKLQNATALASNLMEEIKANSIEDLAFQFNYPVRKDVNNTTRFDIIDKGSFDSAAEVVFNGSEYGAVLKYAVNAMGNNNRDDVTASVIYENYEDGIIDEYEYLGQTSGKYYFILKGAKSGTGKYDALITMNANTYKTPDLTGYNDQTSPVIDSVDVLQDAFSVQSGKWAEELKKKLPNTIQKDFHLLIDEDLSNGELKRTIEIDIEKENTVTKVYVNYKYDFVNYNTGTFSFEEDANRVLRYSNTESPGYDLRSIYLFYMPNYASNSFISSVKDEIIINNPHNVEADIYLVKQKQSAANTYTYETKENSYYCKVYVNEDVGAYNTSTQKGYLSIRTNLNENIYDETETLYYKYDLVYNNINDPDGDGVGSQPASTSDSKRILNVKSLNAEEVKDRIYDVTVAIYEDGQADEDFSDEPIAVITGSKDN